MPVVTGLQGADTVTGRTEAYDNKNADTGKTLSVTGYTINDGNSGNNYTVSTVTNTTGVITQKNLTATYTGTNKTYDGTTAATVTGSSSDIISGDTVTFSQTAAFTNKNVGTGKTVNVTGISLGGTDGGNYTPTSTTATTTANVTPAPLTISANNDSKLFTGAPYSGGNGVSYTGLVNGETGSVLGGTLTYGGTSQGAINVGSYSIVPSGLTATNYSISFADGNLTINANNALQDVSVSLTSVQNSANSTLLSQTNSIPGAPMGPVGPGSGSGSLTNFANSKLINQSN